MNIRYEILRRKDRNRALGDRRKLLKQWISVYDGNTCPGKYHRVYHEKHLEHVEEVVHLTLEIDLNGMEIVRLRSLLKT